MFLLLIASGFHFVCLLLYFNHILWFSQMVLYCRFAIDFPNENEKNTQSESLINVALNAFEHHLCNERFQFFFRFLVYCENATEFGFDNFSRCISIHLVFHMNSVQSHNLFIELELAFRKSKLNVEIVYINGDDSKSGELKQCVICICLFQFENSNIGVSCSGTPCSIWVVFVM